MQVSLLVICGGLFAGTEAAATAAPGTRQQQTAVVPVRYGPVAGCV